MASLSKKNNVYHIRFRYRGRSFKRSLKTSDERQAEIELLGVKRMLLKLDDGSVEMPPGIDPGSFIVSNGELQIPLEQDPPVEDSPSSTMGNRVDQYLESQSLRTEESSVSTQKVHFRHLWRFLDDKWNGPCHDVAKTDLERFLEYRLAASSPTTVSKERSTVLHFFDWAISHGHIDASPAADLAPITSGEDLPEFRTLAEITECIERGGLDDEASRSLWERLYLSTAEISGLLQTVRTNAKYDAGYLLHAIPAYTGGRRGEVLRLSWLDVDLQRGFITFRSRKQSRTQRETSRTIDLHHELQAELVAWRRQRARGQFVICDDELAPLSVDKANRQFWQPMRGTDWCLAGRNRFKVGFHTYRHSFASNLAASGIDQRVIDQIMGHTDARMAARYRHLFPNKRREAMQSFSLAPPAESDNDAA